MRARTRLISGLSNLGAFIPNTLANLSTRAFVDTGDNVMIVGLIVTGGGAKSVLLRALGPTLGQPPFNVPDVLTDPVLELNDSTGAIITSNDNWGDAANAGSIPPALQPANSAESAILTSLNPGAYTAVLRGINNGTGNALLEAYDLDYTAGSKLGNASTRAFVQTGDNVMIAGLIVHGPDNESLLIRPSDRPSANRHQTSPIRWPTRPWTCITAAALWLTQTTIGKTRNKRR